MKVLGKFKFPPTGAIVVSNSMSLRDMITLQRFLRRPLGFLVCSREKFRESLDPSITIENLPEKITSELEDALIQRILSGNGVWFLPLGLPVRTAHLHSLNPLVVTLSQKTQKPIIPVWFENPSTPLFNFSVENLSCNSQYLCRVEPAFAIGEAISHDKANLCILREKLLELGAEVFFQREDIKWSLPLACIKGLKSRGVRTVITDAFLDNKKLNGYTLLGIALAFSRQLKKICTNKRVGIVLPPGIAGMIVNLASVLCGKTPVNLNCTAGYSANQFAMRKAQLTTVFTTESIKERFKDFPWPESTFDVQQLIKNFPKSFVFKHFLAGRLLPTRLLAKIYGIPAKGGDVEAAILFSSGSTGDPKGIVLTHRNILANVTQVREALQFSQEQSLLGCLPIFHSFGFTVTLWYPLCGGPSVVTYISPLDSAKLAQIIQDHKVNLLVTTPSFLRSLSKRAKPAQLSSLWAVVTGAEKLPPELASEFEEKFSVSVREGYGLTETAPVVSVNLSDPPGGSRAFPGQTLHKRGSVGKPVPGIAVRITHPDTENPLPSNRTGIIWLRGANVFSGYLEAADLTQEVLKDGWFKTGDLGRMDEDGFIVIEGRLSRFSKIAGEMVPHGTIESVLQKCFAPESEVVSFAVCGRSHPDRGEELVVLTTLKLTNTTIGEALRKERLPNLWIPKIVKIVDKIPTLPSGKLDLQAIRLIAEAYQEKNIQETKQA